MMEFDVGRVMMEALHRSCIKQAKAPPPSGYNGNAIATGMDCPGDLLTGWDPAWGRPLIEVLWKRQHMGADWIATAHRLRSADFRIGWPMTCGPWDGRVPATPPLDGPPW